MIITVERVKQLPEFSGKTDEEIKEILDAIEILIRQYTNNNFQNRNIRFECDSENNYILNGSSPYLEVGDTIQISESGVNDGLYVIKEINEYRIKVDKKLFPHQHNLVTKIEYPPAIKQGVLNLMVWESKNRKKVGVKSETLSRHSVTYYDQDANNQIMGYPVSLMGFLYPYKKARF